MTQDELREWNQCACVWRCLIKLANMNGNPINRDEFAERFKELFPNRKINDGSFDAKSLSKVCRLLGLPEHSQISQDYSVIEGDFNTNDRDILVMSEIDLTPGHTSVGKHCSVLRKINSKFFSVWTPFQSGADSPLDLERNVWTAKQCFGVALF